MIIKQCQFNTLSDQGKHLHILHPGYDNDHLIKEAAASPPQLDMIRHYLKSMRKDEANLYTLLSALGAGEFWGSNSNADIFPLESLLHTPPNWNDKPLDQQRLIGARWEWGYPTFYGAKTYQHHVNKDPARAFGSIDFAIWDDYMKRVLLVVCINRAIAREKGAIGVVDRIDNGEYPMVSMGCRVPMDLCSVCTDWSRITKNPKVDLAEHKKSPIRGLATTRDEYCQHLKFELNKIYPDGKKVMMINLHPKFFDLSFVFIGADKTSYVLAKLGSQCPIRTNTPVCGSGCKYSCIPSHHVHDVWSRSKTAQEEPFMDPQEEKTVSSFFRSKLDPKIQKKAEIMKRVQSHFSGKALPLMERTEPDIPKEIQDQMSDDLPRSLATTTSAGIVLKPKEFQRICIRSIGRPELADDLDRSNIVFSPSQSPSRSSLIADEIIPSLLRSILPLIQGRSALSPAIHKRIIIVMKSPNLDLPAVIKESSSNQFQDSALLKKIGEDYAAYRQQLLSKTASLIGDTIFRHPLLLNAIMNDYSAFNPSKGLAKEGSNVMKSMVSMFPAMYLNEAYVDQPTSQYIEEHPDLEGMITYGDLSNMVERA